MTIIDVCHTALFAVAAYSEAGRRHPTEVHAPMCTAPFASGHLVSSGLSTADTEAFLIRLAAIASVCLDRVFSDYGAGLEVWSRPVHGPRRTQLKLKWLSLTSTRGREQRCVARQALN